MSRRRHRPRRSPSEKQNTGYAALITDICNMGFTGSFHEDGSPGHVDDYIPEIGQVTSDQFAEWVMLAEGLEPFDGSGFQDDFKKLFARHLGSHVVDASLLKHSVDSSANQ